MPTVLSLLIGAGIAWQLLSTEPVFLDLGLAALMYLLIEMAQDVKSSTASAVKLQLFGCKKTDGPAQAQLCPRWAAITSGGIC